MPVINLRDMLARAAAADAVEGSEDQLALDFSHRHADELRYCAQWGKWLHWDGCRWCLEPTLKAFDYARAVAHDYAKALDDGKLGSAKTVNAITQLARADRRHAAITDQWDTNIWLLNTPTGAIELPAGRLRSHDREDYVTKIAAAAAGGSCPLWLQFLDRIMGGDGELVGYLQRVAGYALTGSTREHALFFCYGKGANGKGVFINTMKAVLGDYAAVAPMETFLASNTDRHPTDLAGLRGARLVCAQEVQEKRRWDAVKIKALTGGDPISARFMRQDFFTYVPEFKLLLAGNHKPGLAGVDEAWRRRFNLIPFSVTIPKADRDLDLFDKLKAEWPGILQWAVEGCRLWAERGLDPPAAVVEATEAYFAEQDSVGRWIEEECGILSVYSETLAHLFASWKAWCERAGLHPGTNTRLSDALDERGFQRIRIGHDRERGFAGIALKMKPGQPFWG
jgi:putative DNA primase/helicase